MSVSVRRERAHSPCRSHRIGELLGGTGVSTEVIRATKSLILLPLPRLWAPRSGSLRSPESGRLGAMLLNKFGTLLPLLIAIDAPNAFPTTTPARGRAARSALRGGQSSRTLPACSALALAVTRRLVGGNSYDLLNAGATAPRCVAIPTNRARGRAAPLRRADLVEPNPVQVPLPCRSPVGRANGASAGTPTAASPDPRDRPPTAPMPSPRRRVLDGSS